MPSEKTFKQRRTFGELSGKGRGGAGALTAPAGCPGPLRASSLGLRGRPVGQAGGGCRRYGEGSAKRGAGRSRQGAAETPGPGPAAADSGAPERARPPCPAQRPPGPKGNRRLLGAAMETNPGSGSAGLVPPRQPGRPPAWGQSLGVLGLGAPGGLLGVSGVREVVRLHQGELSAGKGARGGEMVLSPSSIIGGRIPKSLENITCVCARSRGRPVSGSGCAMGRTGLRWVGTRRRVRNSLPRELRATGMSKPSVSSY